VAKIKYDVSDVETEGGGGNQPQPSVYDGVVKVFRHRTQRNDGTKANDIEVAVDVGEDFAWVYSYVGLDSSSDWKLRQLTDALGLPPKGDIDPDKQLEKKLRVKINPDTYEGEYRARIGRFMKPSSDNGDAPDDEPSEDEPAADEPVDGDFVASREDEANSYDEWTDEDLEAEATDRNLTLPGGRGSKRNKTIAALRADDEEAAGDGAAPDEEPATEAATYPDGYEPVRESDENSYDDWSDDDIDGEFSDRGLDLPGGRGAKRVKQVTALRADDEAAEGGGGAQQADEYDSWDIEELAKEIEERSLELPSGRKTKDKLIAVLREDNADKPF
jgi:hypothetical protein